MYVYIQIYIYAYTYIYINTYIYVYIYIYKFIHIYIYVFIYIGNIVVKSISGVGGLQPVILLRMEGSAAALQSVKLEIMQRIQRHFMQHVRIDWDM
jgi:hypothetical protein